MTGRPAILSGAGFVAGHGDRVAAIAPGYDFVPISAGSRVEADDLERIEVAFFSPDLFPNGVREFFGAAARAPNLLWLHTMSAGVDNPIFGQIRDGGARLTTSSGAAAPAIARTVAMYLLALSRGLPDLSRSQAAHQWERRSFVDLDGQRIGVVGLGPIGLEVVRLAAALGMQPIGMRRRVQGTESCETWPLDRFGELATSVDALVLALPLTPETTGILARDVIDRMKPSAVVLNVGRGELIDEPALAEALASGRLGGAGLDVFAEEPLPPDSPLWDLPNVIITPHNSASTPGTGARAIEIFLDNLRAYVAGEPLRNEITG